MVWFVGGKFSQNEMYLDIVEEVDAIVGMNGQMWCLLFCLVVFLFGLALVLFCFVLFCFYLV